MEKGTKEDKHFVPQNAYPILDSSLIVATKLDLYDIKLVELGDYIQVYLYDSKRSMNLC